VLAAKKVVAVLIEPLRRFDQREVVAVACQQGALGRVLNGSEAAVMVGIGVHGNDNGQARGTDTNPFHVWKDGLSRRLGHAGIQQHDDIAHE
jgi:hypothetical protein